MEEETVRARGEGEGVWEGVTVPCWPVMNLMRGFSGGRLRGKEAVLEGGGPGVERGGMTRDGTRGSG